MGNFYMMFKYAKYVVYNQTIKIFNYLCLNRIWVLPQLQNV